MVLVSNEKFLAELAKLYRSNRSKGSVNCTIKRARPGADGLEKCLVRASAGNGSHKSKISTVVSTPRPGPECSSAPRLPCHRTSRPGSPSPAAPPPAYTAHTLRSALPAQVSAKDHVKFQVQFTGIMRTQFDGLKQKSGGRRKKKASA